MSTDRAIAITKDVILFVGGLCGIAYQQYTNNVNWLLLLVFSSMTGIPGVLNIVALLRNTSAIAQSLPPSHSQQQQPHSRSESANT